MAFEIARDDLRRTRIVEDEPLEAGDGEAVLDVDAFGLTANNVTYAKFGEAMSYWSFFPTAEEGWGRMPVWGFATVTASRVDGVAEGARLYGYLPPARQLRVQPVRVSKGGFVDASVHRANLPPAYNGYSLTTADPVYDADHEDTQMLMRPLFFTSWLIDDFLAEAEMFGAGLAVLSSASSKTSSGLAHLLSKRPGVDVVGLTSSSRMGFVASLGVYNHVVAYDDLDSLPSGRAVFVDMAGDAGVRLAVHEHFGEELAHSAVVGATHHDRMGEVPSGLPGPRPTFFFAPDRVVKRSADWGRAGLEERLAASWHPYVEWVESWLEVVHERGEQALERVYLDALEGSIDASTAHVLTLQSG